MLNFNYNDIIPNLRNDSIAGLTSAVLVLPQAIAYSAIAGLPIEYGIFTAIISPLIAALIGSSSHMISGPTAAMSVLLYSSLSQHLEVFSDSYIAAVLVITFCVGCLQLLMGFFRFGNLTNFVSPAVLFGFIYAAAIIIIVSQAGDIYNDIKQQNFISLLIATITFGVAIAIAKKYPKLPNYLIAIGIGSIFAWLFDSDQTKIQYVSISASNQSLWFLPNFNYPAIDFSVVITFLQTILIIAFVGLLEATAISRTISMKSEQDIDSDREFLGQGASNLLGAIFQCYVSSGSVSRSMANFDSGAKSSMSVLFASLFLILILWLVHGLLVFIPIATIAAIIIIVAIKLIDFPQFMHIVRTSRSSAIVLLVTFGCSILINLEFGICMGIIASLIIFLRQSTVVNMFKVAPDATTNIRSFRDIAKFKLAECPQIGFIKIEGIIFFASLQEIKYKFKQLLNSKQKTTVLLLKSVNQIDSDAANFLIEQNNKIKKTGGNLLINVSTSQMQGSLTELKVLDSIAKDQIFQSKSDLISVAVDGLDKNICATCTARIFNECPKRAIDN